MATRGGRWRREPFRRQSATGRAFGQLAAAAGHASPSGYRSASERVAAAQLSVKSSLDEVRSGGYAELISDRFRPTPVPRLRVRPPRSDATPTPTASAGPEATPTAAPTVTVAPTQTPLPTLTPKPTLGGGSGG